MAIKLLRWNSLLMGTALVLAACQPSENKGQKIEVRSARAVLAPTKGNHVTGVVTFTTVAAGVHIVADIEGLTPGLHGFHIHEKGDCSAADGSSTGGHFNPEGNPHAAPTSAKRHVGDLGNVSADETGHAHFDWTDSLVSLNGKNSVIGRGVIVHGGADDFVSQPGGNAGDRIACGVIEAMP
jgi:Cu-Zn family superoxide dismutase